MARATTPPSTETEANQPLPGDIARRVSAEAEAIDRLVERAVAAAQIGRRSAAIRLLDQALSLNADHLGALLWRGGLSEPYESLPYLERACTLDPNNVQARDGLQWARQRVGLAEPVTSAPLTSDHSVPQLRRLLRLRGKRRRPSRKQRRIVAAET